MGVSWAGNSNEVKSELRLSGGKAFRAAVRTSKKATMARGQIVHSIVSYG